MKYITFEAYASINNHFLDLKRIVVTIFSYILDGYRSNICETVLLKKGYNKIKMFAGKLLCSHHESYLHFLCK